MDTKLAFFSFPSKFFTSFFYNQALLSLVVVRCHLKHRQFDPKGETEVVARAKMVGDSTYQIEVAGAQLVIACNTVGEHTFSVGYQELYALPHKQMGTHAGGESIVSAGITVGLGGPEFIVENRIHIDATRKRVGMDRGAQRETPRCKALPEGERELGIVGAVTRDKSQHHIGFPLLVAPVIPPYSQADKSHATCILHLGVMGNQVAPGMLVTLHPAFMLGTDDNRVAGSMRRRGNAQEAQCQQECRQARKRPIGVHIHQE